jgi:hypothetical protein
MLGVSATTSAMAYGAENWQLGFAGTGTAAGTASGFGFWGWCAFSGGVTSGNDGDCQLSQYLHLPAGGGITCQESLDITSWNGSGGTFVISGTATVNPSGATGPCVNFFPGSSPFSVDTGFPAATGHYNFGTFGTLKGEFQLQVTQIS